MSFVGNRSLQTAGRPPVLTLPTLPRLPTRPPALVTLVLFTLVVLPGPDGPARRPLLRPTRPELVVVLVWDHSTSFRRRSIKRTCKWKTKKHEYLYSMYILNTSMTSDKRLRLAEFRENKQGQRSVEKNSMYILKVKPSFVFLTTWYKSEVFINILSDKYT